MFPCSLRSHRISNDGVKVAAAAYGDHIYLSADKGETWAAVSTANGGTVANWNGVACSHDFANLGAIIWGGNIWYVPLTPTVNPNPPPSSQPLTLAPLPSYFSFFCYAPLRRTSTDSGGSWTERTQISTEQWKSISLSSDGTNIAAGTSGGSLWYDPIPPPQPLKPTSTL